MPSPMRSLSAALVGLCLGLAVLAPPAGAQGNGAPTSNGPALPPPPPEPGVMAPGAAPAAKPKPVRDTRLKTERIVIGKDRIVKLEEDAIHVIISDDAVLGFSPIKPNLLLLTGLGVGETSLTILDEEGEVIARRLVLVVPERARHVSVYRCSGDECPAEETLSCNPVCTRVANPGIPLAQPEAAPALPTEGIDQLAGGAQPPQLPPGTPPLPPTAPPRPPGT